MRRIVGALLAMAVLAGPILAADTAPASGQDATKPAKAGSTKKKHHGQRHQASTKPVAKTETPPK